MVVDGFLWFLVVVGSPWWFLAVFVGSQCFLVDLWCFFVVLGGS